MMGIIFLVSTALGCTSGPNEEGNVLTNEAEEQEAAATDFAPEELSAGDFLATLVTLESETFIGNYFINVSITDRTSAERITDWDFVTPDVVDYTYTKTSPTTAVFVYETAGESYDAQLSFTDAESGTLTGSFLYGTIVYDLDGSFQISLAD